MKLKVILHLFVFVLLTEIASVLLGPIISYFLFSDPQNSKGIDRILVAWLFGAIFSLIPLGVAFVSGIILSELRLKRKFKNIFLLLISILSMILEFLYMDKKSNISYQLGCSLYGMIIGYGIPMIGVYMLFKPFKIDLK